MIIDTNIDWEKHTGWPWHVKIDKTMVTIRAHILNTSYQWHRDLHKSGPGLKLDQKPPDSDMAPAGDLIGDNDYGQDNTTSG